MSERRAALAGGGIALLLAAAFFTGQAIGQYNAWVACTGLIG